MFRLGRAVLVLAGCDLRGGGGAWCIRAAAVGVVLVLAAAAAPDGSRVLAQQAGADLRFAVPVRGGAAPGSPVLARLGPLSVTRNALNYNYGTNSFTVYTGVTDIVMQLYDNGGYLFLPIPAADAALAQRMGNELALLVTRLNSAGDGLFSQSQDTFVVDPEPLDWDGNAWSAGADASRATRIAAALGSAGDRSQWYIIAVDKTVPDVDIDETAGRFVYGSSAPPAPPPPAQVTGVRVAPLDGGVRVSWSAAAGPVDVSQYRVDVADAAGERVRRVYTEADVFEAVVAGLVNGVEYTVTVTALPGHGGAAGPPSEPRTTTPQVGGGGPDGGGGPGEVPVPALPLAGAAVLAGLLASAAYRFRRAGRRASGGGTTPPRI